MSYCAHFVYWPKSGPHSTAEFIFSAHSDEDARNLVQSFEKLLKDLVGSGASLNELKRVENIGLRAGKETTLPLL